MSTKVDQALKQRIWEFMLSEAKRQNIDVLAVNKTKTANQFGVSPRTVGRVVDQFYGKDNSDQESTVTVEETPKAVTVEDVVKVSEKKSKVSVINWTITQNSVLLTLSDGNNASITKDNTNFGEVCKQLLAGNTDVMALVNPAKNFEYEYGNIKVVEDGVLFAGNKLPKEIAFFVIDAVRAGKQADVERFAKFLNNLLENPSYRAVQTLYPFLKHNDIQITDDGMILAWKRITGDFKDCYTKTIDNTIGTVVKVRRNEVEEDPTRTCAKGLHLCAKHYLSSYRGDVVVQCLLNPRDVVAVPHDYNGSKLRCSEYKVLKDVTVEWEAGKL
jgi:hypothetical protein